MEESEIVSLRELIRKRPGMYVGGVDGRGVLHVVLELVANAFDLVLAGRCTRIDLTLDEDDCLTIRDDGPGFSLEGDGRRPGLREILERHSDRPTVDGHSPHVHLGFGGIGLAVANVLSELFELVTICGGQQITARYSRGLALEPLRVEPTTQPPGTWIRFRPDRELFLKNSRVPRDELHARLHDLSYLAPQVRLSWTMADVRQGHGLVDLVKHTEDRILGGVAHRREVVETDAGPIDVEVALTWREGWRQEPVVHAFVNMSRTREPGTHIQGLFDAIRSSFGQARAGTKRQGLVAALALVLSDVTWGSPIKDRLITPAARPAVKQVTLAALKAWTAAHPEAAASIRARDSGQ